MPTTLPEWRFIYRHPELVHKYSKLINEIIINIQPLGDSSVGGVVLVLLYFHKSQSLNITHITSKLWNRISKPTVLMSYDAVFVSDMKLTRALKILTTPSSTNRCHTVTDSIASYSVSLPEYLSTSCPDSRWTSSCKSLDSSRSGLISMSCQGWYDVWWLILLHRYLHESPGPQMRIYECKMSSWMVEMSTTFSSMYEQINFCEHCVQLFFIWSTFTRQE